MKIKRDMVQIHTGTDLGGAKIEPEAQPTRRVLDGAAPMALGAGPGNAQPTGQGIRLAVTADLGNAQQYAHTMQGKCGRCRHFDKRAWQVLANHWENHSQFSDERKFINAMRAQLELAAPSELRMKYQDKDFGEFDVDQAIMDMGLCRVFSEMRTAPVPVPPYGTCPEVFEHTANGVPVQVKAPDRPLGFWQPKSRKAGQMASAAYDRILRVATGQDPGDAPRG